MQRNRRAAETRAIVLARGKYTSMIERTPTRRKPARRSPRHSRLYKSAVAGFAAVVLLALACVPSSLAGYTPDIVAGYVHEGISAAATQIHDSARMSLVAAFEGDPEDSAEPLTLSEEAAQTAVETEEQLAIQKEVEEQFTAQQDEEFALMQAGTEAAEAPKIEDLAQSDYCFMQSQHGRCTLASAVMMMRRAAYLRGDANWRNITEDTLAPSAWTFYGLKNNFAGFGMSVSWHTLGADHAGELINLLDQHPEGVVIYDPGVPHAILLVDYDPSTGVFYVADPSFIHYGAVIPLAGTWNADNRGDQAATLAHITSYWTINN